MFTQNLITDINDRPSLRPPLGSALVALACLVGLWFVAFAFIPKTAALAAASDVSLPAAFPIATGAAAVVRTIIYPAAAIILVAFFASLVGAFSFTIRRLAGGVLHFAMLVLVPLMGALLIVAWIGLFYIYEKEALRTRYFERALERFSLDETLGDRFESLYAEMKADENIEPVAIADVASELSLSDQRSRLSMLVKALEETSDPATRKRLLATLPPFAALVAENPEHHKVVLAIAGETARETFQDVPDFFEWLADQPNGEGWDPLPLYRFETH